MLPDLTPEQKRRFEKGFGEIMADAPEELRERWDGELHWYPDEQALIPQELLLALPSPLLFRFDELFLKLLNRTI